ncbi:MAG TPA: MFS transporter [Chloroflexia bacterium]|nr:MFS transporter [Chloroflexia bacterium]
MSTQDPREEKDEQLVELDTSRNHFERNGGQLGETLEPAKPEPTRSKTAGLSTKAALKFVILFGVVSLFADMTYEGARSINGSFLAVLGANATIVGIVVGFGELVGYGLRMVSGTLGDRTGLYWPITFVGYAINLLAVPLLALAGNWPVAALLMIAERAGRAIRVPTRDAMLAHASSRIGQGWGFGIHEALDQVGATIGPLLIAAVVLLSSGDYRPGYAVLLLPALLALVTLGFNRFFYPRPQDFETLAAKSQDRQLSRPFWLYLLAAALIAAGYVDYPLFAFHFEKTGTVSPVLIPVFFAVAMAVDALTALISGRLYDRLGFGVLVGAACITVFASPLVFLGDSTLALLGVAIWGVGMGIQDSTLRAALASLIAPERRASAYGVFDTAYGVFWFLGSALMGFLYDTWLPGLVIFSVTIQLAAVPVLLLVARSFQRRRA